MDAHFAQSPRELDFLPFVADQDGVLTIRFRRSIDPVNDPVKREKFISIHATDDFKETSVINDELEHFAEHVRPLRF